MSEADRRYWRRADGPGSYDDSAFTEVFSEQDGVHFRLSDPILRTSGVLFLVGQAGLGKSHSLDAEQSDLQAAGQVCLRIDAEAVGSIGDLRELTEPPPNHLGVTWWHIDHLERATNPRQFLLWLQHRLERLEPAERADIRLRVAMRPFSSVRHRDALMQIVERLGASAPLWLILCPLTRAGAASLVSEHNIENTQEFFAEVDHLGLSGPASNPLTLPMLCEQWRRGGLRRLPLHELMREGLRLLAEPAPGGPSVETVLPALQRLAAACVLCARPGVALQGGSRGAAGVISRDDVPPEDLPVLQVACQDGPLFGYDDGRLRFTHWTWAELLAAEAIETALASSNQPDRLLDSLFVAEAGSKRAVPAYEGLLTWLSHLPAVRSRLIPGQPELIRNLDDSDDLEVITAVVNAVLGRVARHEVSDWGESALQVHRHWRSPWLSVALRAWLDDRQRDVAARRVAARLAADCDVGALQIRLAEVALDESDDISVRVMAAASVVRLGSPEVLPKLLPLALHPSPADHDQELLGLALYATWPKLLADADLFAVFPSPRPGSSFGVYKSFLAFKLVEELKLAKPGMIEAAVQWATTLALDETLEGTWPSDLVCDVIRFGFRHQGTPSVRQALVDAWRRFDEALIAMPAPEDADLRHGFFAELLTRAARGELVSPFMNGGVGALRPDTWLLPPDREWAVAQLEIAHPEEKDLWRSAVAWTLRLDRESPTLVEEEAQLRSIAIEVPELADLVQGLIARATAPLASWKQPEPGVRGVLGRGAAATAELWWNVMDLMVREHHTVADFSCLAEFQNLSAPEKEQVRGAALAYLEDRSDRSDPTLHHWVGTHRFATNMARYRVWALCLLHDSGDLGQVSADSWALSAPALLHVPVGRPKEWVTLSALIDEAARRVPDALVATLLSALAATESSNGPVCMSWLRQVKSGSPGANVLGPPIRGWLEGLTSFSPGAKDALGVLGRWDEPAAIAVCERWLLALDLELQTHAAIALVRLQPSQLSQLWPRFRDQKPRALRMLSEVVNLLEFVGSSNRLRRQLPESMLGELFIWLERHGLRRRTGSWGGFGSDVDLLADWKDSLIAELRSRSSEAAVDAMRSIVEAFPKQAWLRLELEHTIKAARHVRFEPLKPKQVYALLQDPTRRVVRTNDELQEAIIEGLVAVEREAKASWRLFWTTDGRRQRPRDETEVTVQVVTLVKSKLPLNVVDPSLEVEVVPERPADFEVKGRLDERQLAVRVEAKLAWHRQVKTAIETQLRNGYLDGVTHRHGIYLVYWFDPSGWTAKKPKGFRLPFSSIDDCKRWLADAAREASRDDYRIVGVVLDLSRPLVAAAADELREESEAHAASTNRTSPPLRSSRRPTGAPSPKRSSSASRKHRSWNSAIVSA